MAEGVQVRLSQLRDDRIRKGADWVSQLSSTELSLIDVQLLYGCRCGTVPMKASAWFLLQNPGGKEFWCCGSCGEKFVGGTSPRFLVVKLPGEESRVFTTQWLLPKLENEVRVIQSAQIIKTMGREDELTCHDVIRAIASLAETCAGRMLKYLKATRVQAQFPVQWPQAKIVCKH